MRQKNKILEQLEFLHLFVFALGALIVVPTHIFPPPTFMYARFPHYLEMMGPFLGVSWPATFEIYHYVLYALAIIVSINALGIVFFPKLRNITIFSSMVGLFLTSAIILFLFFKFTSVNTLTSIIYGIYFVVLFIVDLLTFKVLIRGQKEA